jgi:hypothetical protein
MPNDLLHAVRWQCMHTLSRCMLQYGFNMMEIIT